MARALMRTARLEAFTDGVLAIVITITVLEMKVPEAGSLAGLRGVAPVLLAYALAYVNVGLYWANHHHMLQATKRVNGRVLWANLIMLFWLSLVPWVIRWLDETGFAALPAAAYGVVLGCAALSWRWTQGEIIRLNGCDGELARAVGGDRKGRISVAAYAVAIALAFVSPWAAILIYLGVVLAWLVPDRRIERTLGRD